MAKQTSGTKAGGTVTASLPAGKKKPAVITGGTVTSPLAGSWKKVAGGTVMIALQPGTLPHLKPGEQRAMTVKLSKTRAKGKAGLKLTLIG